MFLRVIVVVLGSLLVAICSIYNSCVEGHSNMKCTQIQYSLIPIIAGYKL